MGAIYDGNVVPLSLQIADRYCELALAVGDYVCLLCPQQRLPPLSVSQSPSCMYCACVSP